MYLSGGVFNSHNEHMLRHPALFSGLKGSYAQGKAFFAQKHIAPIGGIDGNYGIVLGKLADEAVFGVHIHLGMKPPHPIVAFSQNLKHPRGNTGHDEHIQHHINRIRHLYAYLREGRAYGPHGIGDYIHNSALITSPGDVIKLFVHFIGGAPVVGGAGVLLFPCADEGSVLHPSHIVDSRAMQIASGELFLIQHGHLSRGAGLAAKGFPLLVAPVNPKDFIGVKELFHFL